MIAELELPEYYLESVDIDVSPTVGETVMGVMGSNLELETPSLDDDPKGFHCEASLSLTLFYNRAAPWQVENEEEIEEFGTVETRFRIYLLGEPDELEPYVDEWISTGEYRAVDSEFRHHLESGILQYVIDPIGELLENSYSGIVPRIALTHMATNEGDSGE